MKKIYTLLCIAATMLAACAKENLVENDATPQDEEVKYIDVTFDAEFPVPAELQDNAKTMLNSDLSVSWSEGDQIAVNNDETSLGTWGTLDLNYFTAAINPNDPHRAIFSGKINEKAKNFFAVYPSADVELGKIIGASDGKIYIFLPNSQTAKEGSFANGCALSYACGSVSGGIIQDKIEFYNLCAILEFTMPEYVEGAQTVNIKSNDGTNMSGGCVINRKNFVLNSFGPSSEKKPVSDNVTVTAPNTASKFYAVIFPGNYSNGFNITVTTANGQVYSRNVTKALNAQANHIYNLGTLGVVLDEQKVDLNVHIEQDITTGSVATFNIAATGDFKAMVKSWDISLYNSADQLVRKIEGNTTGSGKLEIVDGYKLLAAGDYYAKVSYYMQTGSKRDAIKIEGITAPQFQIEGVVINATPTLNYEGNTLNGTDVELSFDTKAVDPDLAKLIKWENITLTDKNSNIYRTATAAGKMTPAAGKPYLPKGTYTLTAYFTLPELGSTKSTALDPKTIEVNLTPTFGVELLSAKTSYDYYKAGGADNINKANACHNMGIYELAANMTGRSISSEVAAQMIQDKKFYYEWFLDGKSIGTTDGNNSVSNISKNTDDGAVQVDFGNKNVKCTLTFDNIVKDSGNIAVDITGLPYRASSFSKKDDDTATDNNGKDWVRKSWNNKVNGSALQCGGVMGSRAAAWRSDFHFYLPSSIDVTLSCPSASIYSYKPISRVYSTTFKGSINGNEVFSQNGPSEKGTKIYSPSGSGTISNNADQILLTSTYEEAGPYVCIYNVQLLYR